MPRLDTVMVLLLAMPAPSFATAQPVRNTAERISDRRQIALDRTWAERDAREVQEFQRLTNALKDAYRDRMNARYSEVNECVLQAMSRETEQAEVKTAQAAREARMSRREWRDERMEANVTGSARDRLEAADDRHDLRDDRRDRDTAALRHDDMVRIGTEAGALQNDIARGNRSAMRRNVSLAEDFLGVMQRDLAATQAERAEDRAELREDRRESRTDRR